MYTKEDMGTSKASRPLTVAQEKARFDNWVKEDRIPNIQRKHHWKTWLRALGMTEQELRIVAKMGVPADLIRCTGIANNQAAAVAAIQFALEQEDGMTFLHLWFRGDFDSIRLGWPDAPEAVHITGDTRATDEG